MRLSILFFFIAVTACYAQTITYAQYKAMNNFVDYANKSADEVNAVVTSIINYYPTINRKNTVVRYVCPIQVEDYFLKKAMADASVLGGAAGGLKEKLSALRNAAEQIDKTCKALDTYHKLDDYKTDNFDKARLLIDELRSLIVSYSEKQVALSVELELSYKKLNKISPVSAYTKTDEMFRGAIEEEKKFINAWNFNLKEEVHSGWPDDKIETSITETKKQIDLFESYKPAISYPTLMLFNTFKESLDAMLELKRRGLDEYNSEAKKTDTHSNRLYADLLNYFNGALIDGCNSFVEYAAESGYFGVKRIKYITRFEIRTQQKIVSAKTNSFQDVPYKDLKLVPEKTPISKSIFVALNSFVDFINESLRQVNYLQLTVRNLNSSATYYKDLTSYKGKGGLHYDYKSYQIPLSIYQETVENSQVLTVEPKKSLNEQTAVLLDILKELNQLSASLERETSEKQYEQDNLKRLYEIIERHALLFKIFDEKKERLYTDVRRIYMNYPPAKLSNSWYVSGKALQNLTDYDHEALFAAKDRYVQNNSTIISTERIDNTLRDVLSNEYTNMKGIEKLGRYNGNCPYTPYEDIPATSKRLSEKINTMKTTYSSGQHPYHDLVYLYNDIVDDMNKFCELSKDVWLLKTVHQPELFVVKYAENKQQPSPKHTAIPPTIEKQSEIKSKEKSTVVRDTVYVEKHDTIYIGSPAENTRSMEGYANNNMVLLLDVSGSMNAPEKLPLLKSSVLDLLTMMRTEDEVSIVVYSGKAKVLLSPTSFKEERAIKTIIDKLKSEGKTDGNAGLKLAYKVADENYIRGGNNRIIVATDGEFPISDEVYALVDKFSKNDIFISVFNFGKSASKNLQRLASTGRGNYEHITKENVEMNLIREVKSKRSK